MVLHNVWKVSVWKHAILGCSGGMPPRKFRTSEIASAGFSGQILSVAKIIHISMQHSGSTLIAIQLSRKPLLVLNVSDPCLFRSHADSFACGANLKLRQANARAQAKVARARAQVCQGLATPLTQRDNTHTYTHMHTHTTHLHTHTYHTFTHAHTCTHTHDTSTHTCKHTEGQHPHMHSHTSKTQA